jgi:hypothetical protein
VVVISFLVCEKLSKTSVFSTPEGVYLTQRLKWFIFDQRSNKIVFTFMTLNQLIIAIDNLMISI